MKARANASSGERPSVNAYSGPDAEHRSLLERRQRRVNALPSHFESLFDLGYPMGLVEIPAHSECGWREEISPLVVVQFRAKTPVCFDDWMVPDGDTTQIVGPPDFEEDPWPFTVDRMSFIAANVLSALFSSPIPQVSVELASILSAEDSSLHPRDRITYRSLLRTSAPPLSYN